MKHEAFLYMWTDYKERYIGYHKGDIDDGYICSASEEFYTAFYSNRKWKRRILATGTELEMLKLEHEILKRVDAKNNNRYYNKSNGGIYKKDKTMKTNFELIEKLKKSIPNREIKLRKTTDVYTLPRYQTRAMNVYKDKVNQIAEKIQAAGNTDKMAPIVVVTDTTKGDQLLDGNHTIHAAKQALSLIHI